MADASYVGMFTGRLCVMKHLDGTGSRNDDLPIGKADPLVSILLEDGVALCPIVHLVFAPVGMNSLRDLWGRPSIKLPVCCPKLLITGLYTETNVCQTPNTKGDSMVALCIMTIIFELALRLPRLLQRPQHILGTQRQLRNPHARGVVDCVTDTRHRRHAGDLAGAGVVFD